MEKEGFRYWLQEVEGKSTAQVSDHLSRVKRIEGVFSVLDGQSFDVEQECKKDGCQELLNRLTLAKRDQMPVEINLPTNMMGISRLRSSLRKYIEYYYWRDKKIKR